MFDLVERESRPADFAPVFFLRRRGVCILSLLAVCVGGLAYVLLQRTGGPSPATLSKTAAPEPVAELVSAEGRVLARKGGRNEWSRIAIGDHFMDGDLIQTDLSGQATIRYSNGNMVAIGKNTVLTVRKSEEGSMDISVPVGDDIPYSRDNGTAKSGADGFYDSAALADFNAARAREIGPFIRLDAIIQFGRSLELVGAVEAGSRLSVNNEIVEVAGDGTFKHFTNPFPASVRMAGLTFKVTDLAGRTRVVTATYDFNPRREAR